MPITVDATKPKIQEAMQYGAKDLVKDLWDLTKEKVTKKVDLTKAPEQSFDEFWSSLSDEKKTKITELALAPSAGMLKPHAIGKLGVGMLNKAKEIYLGEMRGGVLWPVKTEKTSIDREAIKKGAETLTEMWKYPQSFYSRIADVGEGTYIGGGPKPAGWVTGYQLPIHTRPITSISQHRRSSLGFDLDKMSLAGESRNLPARTGKHEMTHVIQHIPFSSTPRNTIRVAWDVHKKLRRLQELGYKFNTYKYSPIELHAGLMEGVTAAPTSALYKQIHNSALTKALRMSRDNIITDTAASLQTKRINQPSYEKFLEAVADIDYILGNIKP